jgi:peptidoglycan hydrolase CwlO-like protein
MKRLQALAAAVIITGLVGLGMLAIGVNAALNPNTVAASNAPGDPATDVSAASPDAQAQVKQLQDLVAQYQDREKQYQAQLNQYQSREQQYQAQLNQAGAQLQQYQQLLVELQRRGLIRINGDGSILLPRRGFGSGDNGG